MNCFCDGNGSVLCPAFCQDGSFEEAYDDGSVTWTECDECNGRGVIICPAHEENPTNAEG